MDVVLDSPSYNQSGTEVSLKNASLSFPPLHTSVKRWPLRLDAIWCAQRNTLFPEPR